MAGSGAVWAGGAGTVATSCGVGGIVAAAVGGADVAAGAGAVAAAPGGAVAGAARTTERDRDDIAVALAAGATAGTRGGPPEPWTCQISAPLASAAKRTTTASTRQRAAADGAGGGSP